MLEGLAAQRKLDQIETALVEWIEKHNRLGGAGAAQSLAETLLAAIRDESRLERAQKLLHPERRP